MCVREVVLETLPKGKKFYRERAMERPGVVISHGPGGSLVEFHEPKTITIKGQVVAKTTKKSRVQIARRSHVWIEERVKRTKGD